MAKTVKTVFDLVHVKAVSVFVLFHADSDRPGKLAGRIVSQYGRQHTSTVHIWSGPLSFLPGCTGKNYGLSDAIYMAFCNGKADNYTYSNEDHDKQMKAQLAALVIPEFMNISQLKTWLASFGYELEAIIGR